MPEFPTLRFEPGSKVVPGDRIGTVHQVFPGVGTYARGGNIYASLLGQLEVLLQDDQSYTTSVTPHRPLASHQVIRVGQLALCRVSRVAAPAATVKIVAVEGIGHLTTPVEGSISKEEAYKSGTAKNSREIHECFQPSDIVVAKVLALGDARKYMLTTAEAELGVIHALCHASQKPMVPSSWKEMECPETGIKEPRKCAKPRKVVLPATGTEETMETSQPMEVEG